MRYSLYLFPPGASQPISWVIQFLAESFWHSNCTVSEIASSIYGDHTHIASTRYHQGNHHHHDNNNNNNNNNMPSLSSSSSLSSRNLATLRRELVWEWQQFWVEQSLLAYLHQVLTGVVAPVLAVLGLAAAVLYTYLTVRRRFWSSPAEYHLQAVTLYQTLLSTASTSTSTTSSNNKQQERLRQEVLALLDRAGDDYIPARITAAAVLLYTPPGRDCHGAAKILQSIRLPSSHDNDTTEWASAIQLLQLDAAAVQSGNTSMLQDVLRQEQYCSPAFVAASAQQQQMKKKNEQQGHTTYRQKKRKKCD